MHGVGYCSLYGANYRWGSVRCGECDVQCDEGLAPDILEATPEVNAGVGTTLGIWDDMAGVHFHLDR